MARAVNPRLRSGKYLALPPATGQLPEAGGDVLRCVATPTRKQIEHAGHVYQLRLKLKYGIRVANDKQPASGTDSEQREKNTGGGKRFTAATGSELQRKLATDGDDLYALLELGDKRWHATAEDIRKSFRRMSLLYHPDKIRHKVKHLGEEGIAEAESHFKKILKANDILSDKKKRAAYDSIDDVDDLIPSEGEVNDKNFYELLGERFAINSRWSVSNRVPKLGDESTSIDEVHKFYDFWYSFKTWRDFSFDLEYDTDQAECREEKRWMDRQNAKKIKARKLEESQRIRELTDLAYKKDPRIRMEKEALKKKKQDMKEARRKEKEEEEARKREQEEKARLEEEIRLKTEKERKAQAKREKDAARRLLRDARKKLRGVARDLALSDVTSVAAIEKMCSEGDVHTIEAFADELMRLAEVSSGSTGDDVPGVDVANITEIVEEALAVGLTTQKSKPVPHIAEAQPCGSSDSKPLSESQENLPNGCSTKQNSGWTQEEMSLLSKGLGKFPGGTKNRWERLAQYVGTRSADEVLTQIELMRAGKIRIGKGKVSKTKGVQSAKQGRQESTNSGVPQEGPPKDTSSTPSQQSKVPNRLGFSSDQQTQLEAAMKEFKSEPAPSKWEKIAAQVTGRDPAECEERVNELVLYYRSKKGAKS